MLPSGSPAPVGGQSMSNSHKRTHSAMLVGQGAQMPPQAPFSSLMSPRTQYSNGNLLGNVPNVSSFLNQYNNVGANSGLPGPVNNQSRSGLDVRVESDPRSGVANGMGFNPPSSSFVSTNLASVGPSGQAQGQQFSGTSRNQLLPDQPHTQQLENPNFQHGQQQFSANHGHGNHQQPQPQQYNSIRGGLAGVPQVKLDPQVTNDQGHQQQAQLQFSRSLGVKMEQPSQLQGMGQMSSIKMESQHSDQPTLLNQQPQQQQLHQMSMSRQSSPAAATAQISFLQQQKMLQLQQQQQHLKNLPQQRSQAQQQLQPQNMPVRSPSKSLYEPGMCARRITNYMYQQQHRPEDNNIEFWKKFVAFYFAPNAKKRWCVSMYGTGRQTTAVFPQDVWHCEICSQKPGRGFEATYEVLPRLFKIKYESGTLEELLYIDMPKEYLIPSGKIVLDYAKAVQESVFEHLRVVREGQLRIVFSADLKICSWEFCARKHEELIPRKLLIPQVSHLGSAAQKYQTATQNASSNLSVSDLQNNCNMFVSSARQLAKTLEVPLVNDLGYTKRYVRCLQISEVVNSMKDLMDYSRITGTGPMDTLAKFGRRTSTTSVSQGQNEQHDEQQQPSQHPQPSQLQQPSQQQQQHPQQQPMVQSANNDQRSVQASALPHASNNGMHSVNSTLNMPSASTSASTIAGLLHQNSMNTRQQNPMSNVNSPYGGNSMPSPGVSSGTMQQGLANPSLQPPTPSSNNPPQTSHSPLVAVNNHPTNLPANISVQQPALSGEGGANNSQSSVQKMLQEMMMSGQLNGPGGMIGVGSLGNGMKNVNGVIPQNTNIGPNYLVGNGPTGGNSGIGGSGFVGVGGGIGQSAMGNGIRPAMGNNPVGLNGRVGLMPRDQSMSHQQQQQDVGSQVLSGLAAPNGFDNLQFDWKSS